MDQANHYNTWPALLHPVDSEGDGPATNDLQFLLGDDAKRVAWNQ